MQVDYSGRMASVYRAGRSLPVSVVTAWVDAAVRHVDRDAAGVVCDLGSGTGRFSAVLASCLGPPLVAIEPAAGMREQARMQTPRRCASLLGGLSRYQSAHLWFPSCGCPRRSIITSNETEA